MVRSHEQRGLVLSHRATQALLDRALHFAAQRNAIPTEVGVIDQPEPPPIILEPPDNVAPFPDDEEVYVGMDEISEDLQRGLQPPISPPMAEAVLVVAATSTAGYPE